MEYIDKCPGDATAIWLDALCIPGHNASLRREAIARMRDIYAQADVVLVFDIRLMQTTSKSKYIQKLEILKSDWKARLWTLQEGRECFAPFSANEISNEPLKSYRNLQSSFSLFVTISRVFSQCSGVSMSLLTLFLPRSRT